MSKIKYGNESIPYVFGDSEELPPLSKEEIKDVEEFFEFLQNEYSEE